MLDDWGYSLQQVKLLSAIRQPLTVAILPNLPYSTEVARAAHSQGHEVILHQPMEAFDEREPKESATITAGMPAGEALRTLRQCLATVPFASGISNHQGSRATSDSRLMQTLLSEVRRQGLYFLDSRVTAESVGMQMARSLRVRFIRRSVFIDNEKSPDEIRERLGELAKLAQKRGSALGIGHDRPNTLRVLLEAAPALERAGYTLVPASELAEIPGDVVS
ncbi:MAG: divergent polysaccharide deacetylase family protein [Candidatus Omnitrophica bacterium]|nr:divergent polysaccharide deacetylase family protein [Candidatus Omnitrophota bacterium]